MLLSKCMMQIIKNFYINVLKVLLADVIKISAPLEFVTKLVFHGFTID